MSFPKIPSHPNFYTLQEEILQFWEENNIFEKSINQRSSDNSYRFYDGPPFKNGLPHYGHALQSTIKDIIPRFWSMKGKKIERKRGWDCHGIYIEQKVQKKLGLESNKDIEAYGIDKFMKACLDFTNEANDEWDRFIPNLGRRVDFRNAYETSSPAYMESVRWVFKNLWEKDLIYKGKRVSMYSTKLNTAISSFEVQADNSYAEVPDPAITVKFPVIGKGKISGFEDVTAGVIKTEKGYLMLYTHVHSFWCFPGRKVPKEMAPEESLQNDILKSLGCNSKITKKLGATKTIFGSIPMNIHYFEMELLGEPKIQNKDEYSQIGYAKIDPEENELGYSVTIENLVFSSNEELRSNFFDYRFLLGDYFNHINQEAKFSFLARTTTPRTIPANLALVVSPDITYAQIYDLKANEYFILAENLITKFYKDPSDYLIIYKCKGTELEGISYKPPFDFYYPHPLLSPSPSERVTAQSIVSTHFLLSEGEGVGGEDVPYNANNHQVYLADYVTDTDGTGIVHTAPEFGEDDFKTGLKYGLTQSEALDEAGKYTNEIYSLEVPDLVGMYYREANDVIMNKLKEKGLLVKKESITHTVAICPRTQVPLIFKTQDSRFINIQSVKEKLIEKCKEINRVPDHLRLGRFLKNIESAPDRCISRTRYRATPMPVWTDGNGNYKVIGSMEDLFALDQTGSKRITKFRFIRHGESLKNIEKWRDSRGDSLLTDKGLNDAEKISNNLVYSNNEIIVISPLERAFQTVLPYIKKHYANFQEISEKYMMISETYKKSFDDGSIWELIKSKDTSVHKISENIYVDFRICETLLPKYQGKPFKHLWKELDIRAEHSAHGESTIELYNRIKLSLIDRKQSNNVIFATHGDPVVMMRMFCDKKDYHHQMKNYPRTGSITEYYIDKETNHEFDSHRPGIDNIRGLVDGIKYTRVTEVLDPWLDSGSMPYAQDHYPFENEQHFKDGFPADFIGEGLGQIRAWFYVMHVLGVTLFDTVAYKNVICTGTVLGNDGRKMSKTFGNYPDIKPTIEAYGADSIRMFFANSPLLNGGDQPFTEESLREIIKKIHLPLWNSFSFFVTYANIDNFTPTKFSINDLLGYNFENDLDSRIIGKTAQLISEVDIQVQAYSIQKAIAPIYDFLDDLTNRYIRRSRRRFWKGEMDNEKLQGYETLFVVLVELCKVLAPFMPFLTEYIFKALTGKESVHLEDRTVIINAGSNNQKLLADMDLTKQIVELGLSLRGSLKCKVKQPLQSLKINKLINPAYEIIIKEELNIKELIMDESLNNQITVTCVPNARIVGKKLGSRFAEINNLAKSGQFTLLSDNRAQVSDIVLEADEYELRYEKGELAGDLITSGDLILMLDTAITPELKLEGYARELIRSIQEARKSAGYAVTDRILLSVSGFEVNQIINNYGEFISSETLSTITGSIENSDYSGECDVDEGIIIFSIKK